MSTLTPGSTLQNGEYQIQRKLGQGGFGITYLALQRSLNRKVVVKEFFLDGHCTREEHTHHVTVATGGSPELVASYYDKVLKEARHIAQLEHPNIVSIISVFEENNTAYYVMKYAPNGSLEDKVKREGHLSEPEATRYILKIAKALRFVHEHKMTHLDVKPANILLSVNDEPLLIDFGLSKQYDYSTGKATSHTPLGISNGYAPIEQYDPEAAGNFSPEMDIYSLGATFFNLLTGITPQHASIWANNGIPVQELHAKNVSQRAISVIFQAIEPLRKDRLHDMGSFIRLLEGDAVPKPQRVSKTEPSLPTSNDINSNMQELPERPVQQDSVVQSIGWNYKQALFVLVGEIAFAFFMLTFSRSIHTDSDGWALMVLYSALTIVILCYLSIKTTGISTKNWKRIRIISTFLCLANSMLLPIWNGSLTGTYLFLSISLSLISSLSFLVKASKSKKEVTSTNPQHSVPQENNGWSTMRNNSEKPHNASSSKR